MMSSQEDGTMIEKLKGEPIPCPTEPQPPMPIPKDEPLVIQGFWLWLVIFCFALTCFVMGVAVGTIL